LNLLEWNAPGDCYLVCARQREARRGRDQNAQSAVNAPGMIVISFVSPFRAFIIHNNIRATTDKSFSASINQKQ
jgi:hypothetical protein